MKVWSSKALREFDDGEKVGEPKASEHEADMIQVEAPSSMTILCTPCPFENICTKMKAGMKWEVYIFPCQKLQAWNPKGQPHQLLKTNLSFMLDKFSILRALT